MRLFHKDLLSVLPTMQLKGQFSNGVSRMNSVHTANKLTEKDINRFKDEIKEQFSLDGVPLIVSIIKLDEK